MGRASRTGCRYRAPEPCSGAGPEPDPDVGGAVGGGLLGAGHMWWVKVCRGRVARESAAREGRSPGGAGGARGRQEGQGAHLPGAARSPAARRAGRAPPPVACAWCRGGGRSAAEPGGAGRPWPLLASPLPAAAAAEMRARLVPGGEQHPGAPRSRGAARAGWGCRRTAAARPGSLITSPAHILGAEHASPSRSPPPASAAPAPPRSLRPPAAPAPPPPPGWGRGAAPRGSRDCARQLPAEAPAPVPAPAAPGEDMPEPVRWSRPQTPALPGRILRQGRRGGLGDARRLPRCPKQRPRRVLLT